MKEITIISFGEYVEYVEKYKGKYFFRGHSNANWSIVPSLFRNTAMPNLDEEFINVSEKMSSNSSLSPITALFDLQHYGTPTRICDLTISPLGALFFASENEEDGAVFVIDKSKTIGIDNYAIGLISLMLEKGISTFLELQKESDGLYDVFEIINKNYIVEYKDLAYTNPRAFRQGGTGIIFGFGKCGNAITSKGNSHVDEFIFEKIIIPHSVKIEAQRYLYRLGYSNEMLYDVLVGNDDVALTETKFTCQQRFDKTPFYKIIAEYQVDSLYFDRDKLALKIEAIYNALFRKYGTNARIWTFYFYDENDIGATKNWICRGVWREKTQYAIEWTKTYYAYRLNHLNEQISRRESIERHSALIKQIEPLYNQIYTLISIENFEIATFFALISSMQREVAGIGSKANDIPFSTNKPN